MVDETDTGPPRRDTEYVRERYVARDVPPAPPEPERWQMKRSVDLAVVVAVVGQLIVGVWFASAESSKVADNARRIGILENSQAALSATITVRLEDMSVRLTKIETTLIDLRAQQTEK